MICNLKSTSRHCKQRRKLEHQEKSLSTQRSVHLIFVEEMNRANVLFFKLPVLQFCIICIGQSVSNKEDSLFLIAEAQIRKLQVNSLCILQNTREIGGFVVIKTDRRYKDQLIEVYQQFLKSENIDVTPSSIIINSVTWVLLIITNIY